VLLPAAPRVALAQEPPPRIGPFVIEVHGTIPRFSKKPQLAESRGLELAELPGAGFGLHAGVHVYPLTWRFVTFGLGVDATAARAHQKPRPISATELGRAVTETFKHVAPELSFNFGNGNGWSYLSAGLGPALWSVVPDGTAKSGPDVERLRTLNYGGGARWFVNPHLAFALDARFYAIDPSTAVGGRPGGPRTTMMFFGAGIAVK
jgi:hypothetical protein